MSYENPWRFNGEIFESSNIQDYFGFVYHIHCATTGLVMLVENISGLSAHRRANLEKLRQSPIGKHITDPVLNSKMTLRFGEKIRLAGQSLASIKQKDNATSKKPNSFS